MDDIRYDYDLQVWIVNGRYQGCGHPETMDCRCYGRLHNGETAPPPGPEPPLPAGYDAFVHKGGRD